MAGLIDWHSHHAPSEVLALLGSFGGATGGLDPEDSEDFDARRAQLDGAGIDLQLVALTAAVDTETRAPAAALALVRAANDAIAARVATAPDRFAGVCSVTLRDVPGSVAELDRMAARGFRAVLLLPRCDGEVVVDLPETAPLFAKIAELDLPIFLHGGGGMPRSLRLEGLEDGGAGLTTSVINEAGICEWAVRAIASGLFDRQPNLRVVVRSGGGLVPMLVNRLTWRHQRADGTMKHYGEELRQHFAVDSRTDPETVAYIVDHLGEDALVFGSDFGGGSGGMRHSLVAIDRQADPGRVRTLMERNTRRLLKV